MTNHSEIWVTCPACPHTWVAAHLPMEAAKACKLLLATHCPRCGVKKGLTMASDAEIIAAIAKPRSVTA